MGGTEELRGDNHNPGGSLVEALGEIYRIVRRLRAPDGCPWDRKQTLWSLRGAPVEEAYELLDAIEEENPEAIKEELGDLLLLVFSLSIIAEDTGLFTLEEVARGLARKLIRRHPHVFGQASSEIEDVLERWEKDKGEFPERVPGPALMAARKLGQKAARLGFDWSGPWDVVSKVEEELEELKGAMRDGEGVGEELGDLLFAVAQLARHLGLCPENELRKANQKFARRFKTLLARVPNPRERSQEELDRLWEEIKDEP